MRIRRKKKQQPNSQSIIQPKSLQRAFDNKSSQIEQTADLQTNQKQLQQSGLNFGDIPVFASNRLSSSAIIQPQLTIGAPGDKYEREADTVAERVVNQINSPQAPAVQRETLPEEEEKVQPKLEINRIQRSDNSQEEETAQAKPLINSFFSHLVQRQSDGLGVPANPKLESSINQAKGKGEPLSKEIKQPMEQAFGADFSGVKVHADAQSDQMNQSIQAKAFTTGQDIFFKQGAYNPSSRSGQTLIAHELTHVVQQNGSGIQRKAETTRDFISRQAIKTSLVQDAIVQRDDQNKSAPTAKAPMPPAPLPPDDPNLIKLVKYLCNDPKPTGKRAEKIAHILLTSRSNSGHLNHAFSIHANNTNQETIVTAIERVFTHNLPAKEYLVKVAQGESQSLIAQLLLTSGLATDSGTDPEHMVTLVEYAPRQELRELADKPNLKSKILDKFNKNKQLRTSIFNRHQDKRSYVEAILEGVSHEEAILESSNQIEKIDDELHALEDSEVTEPIHQSLSEQRNEVEARKESAQRNLDPIKLKELKALLNILRGSIALWRSGKKLTNPEAEERIMKWAARQTQDTRDYVAAKIKTQYLDRFFSTTLPEGYKNYIKSLIELKYSPYKPDEYSTNEERQEHVEQLVAERKPQALVSYLFDKKQTFGLEVPVTQNQSVGGGGVLGYWEGLAKRIEDLSPQGRLDFLQELFQRSGNKNDFTRGEAIEELKNQLIRMGGNQNKEAFQRMLNACKAEATQNTPERRSTPNLLRILVERWWISGNRLQFTSRDAVELVSKLQPSEYLEVIRNKDLLTKLKAIVGTEEWQRISEILGLDEWRELHGSDEELPTIPLDEENVDAIAQARSTAANLIELRPEHWAAKLSHELEKGYLAIHVTNYTSLDGRAWDRNRVFSLVQQAFNAAERKAEQDSEVKTFMNSIQENLTSNAITALNEKRLAPAKQALEQGRQISAAERIQGATFRAWYEGGIGKRWFRGRGMRERSLLNAIVDAQGEQLLEWSNFDRWENTIKELEALPDNDLETILAKRAAIKAFKLDIKPEFRQDLERELPASEFEEVYSTILYKLANALEKDEVVKETIAKITSEHQVPDELQDLGVTAELLRFKALKESEELNSSGVQWDWFSSKGAQRQAAMVDLEGKVNSVNEKLSKGKAVDKEELTQARKRAEGKKARFIEMRETAKQTTLRCVGLILAAACTVATGGFASLGFTGIGVSVALSAARALVLQGVSAALEGKAYNPWEGLLFEIIKDSALAATTFGAGELSNFIESSGAQTLAKAAADDGKFAEALGKNFGNISPIEATLRTITGSSLEAMTSADHQDWYEKKSGIFWNTLVTAVKDSASKSLFDMSKLGYGDDDLAYASVDDDKGKSIFENNQAQLIPWVFAEMFTGQNVAVCEMTTLQDGHINLLSNKFAALLTKGASPQRPLGLEEDQSSRPKKKLRYKQGIASSKGKKLTGSKLVARAEQESDLRDNDTADIASQWLDSEKDVSEKIKFLKIGLGASAYQCLALGYTPEQVSQYFASKEITKSGEKLIEDNKVGNSEEFTKQLSAVQENEETFIADMVNDRSVFKAYKKDLLTLGVDGGKWADHYEIQAVARGLGRQIQLHKLKNNAVISTDSYGQGDPAYHLVIENNFHYGALQANPNGNITIDGQRYEHISVAPSGDCFYDALSQVSSQGILVLRQMAFDNMTLGEIKQSIRSVILNLSIGEQLGIGRNMKEYYQSNSN